MISQMQDLWIKSCTWQNKFTGAKCVFRVECHSSGIRQNKFANSIYEIRHHVLADAMRYLMCQTQQAARNLLIKSLVSSSQKFFEIQSHAKRLPRETIQRDLVSTHSELWRRIDFPHPPARPPRACLFCSWFALNRILPTPANFT